MSGDDENQSLLDNLEENERSGIPSSELENIADSLMAAGNFEADSQGVGVPDATARGPVFQNNVGETIPSPAMPVAEAEAGAEASELLEDSTQMVPAAAANAIVHVPIPEAALGNTKGASVMPDGSQIVEDAFDPATVGQALQAASIEMTPISDFTDEPLPEGENPNPELAVDEMLASAVLAELPAGADPAAATASAPVTNPACFQLRIMMEKFTSRDQLQKLAEMQGLSVPSAAWTADTPIISQLTEYQAIRFRVGAMALGYSVVVDAVRPGRDLSEDDLALGELADVPDPNALTSEGAPAVQLPAGQKEVLLYSADNLPGYPVRHTLGIVSAHRSIARRFFRESELAEKLERELHRLPGRAPTPLAPSRLAGLLREISLDLQKAALAAGGNAVLGIRIDAFPESASVDPALEQMRLVAFGTAAVVEKAES